MTILNQADLISAIDARTPDNTDGDISPLDIRNNNYDLIDSLQAYAAVTSGGAVATFPIGLTPTPYPALIDTNSTPSATPVLEADYVNNQLKVFENGRYLLTYRLQAEWSNVQSLTNEARVNGVTNWLTPVSITQEGNAAPLALSFTNVTFLVNDVMIAAGPGGAYASIKMYYSMTQANTDFTQTTQTFGLQYGPLSIDTIPEIPAP
jgi:hypothetical protein